MRDAFSDALVRLAQADPRVVLLTGDHGYALFDSFRRHCPKQYINAGIAEQNMVGMAAGMARVGYRPFVYGLSAFIPIRVLEQIKLDVAHDRLPVVLLGDGAGFVYSHLGTSHQSTEDVACARSIPNLAVLSPADAWEMSACMDLAYSSRSPVYLRMGKSDRGAVHQGPLPQLALGNLLTVRPMDVAGGVALIGTGSMVKTAMDIVCPGSGVWSAPSIKPLDVEVLCAIAQRSRAIIVLEEHSTLGGLGSHVSEILSERQPTRVLRIGVADRFSEHCGTYAYLLREHGLDSETVQSRIDAFLAMQ